MTLSVVPKCVITSFIFYLNQPLGLFSLSVVMSPESCSPVN